MTHHSEILHPQQVLARHAVRHNKGQRQLAYLTLTFLGLLTAAVIFPGMIEAASDQLIQAADCMCLTTVSKL